MGRTSFFTTRMNSSFFSISGTNSRMRANMGKSPFVLGIVNLVPRDFFLALSAESVRRVQRSQQICRSGRSGRLVANKNGSFAKSFRRKNAKHDEDRQNDDLRDLKRRLGLRL